jgi:hypothetical protein
MLSERRSGSLLIGLAGLLSAGILCYSQTTTVDWDEGFHLIAAYVIGLGKRPYIDFCFPQTSLHAYWNAFWIGVLGRSWRGPHLAAAALTSGALALTVDFVYGRLRNVTASVAAALLIGLNAVVVEFGTKAQAYGAGLFLTVAAFRAAVAAVEKRSWLFAAAAGMLASAAASCSLLTAPAGLVLFLWIVWQRRGIKLPATFLGGALIPLAPVIQAFVAAPYVTWFNLVSYHIFYRHVKWEGATAHDFEVLVSWSNSGRILLLSLLAAAGFFFLRKCDWPRERKAPFYLALWVALGLGLESAFAHPTFGQYFIFVVPFLAIPAAVGFIELCSRFAIPEARAIAMISVILALGIAGTLEHVREDNDVNWSDLDDIAAKVAQVTPQNATLLADPHIYFLLGRTPPSGTEFPASHKLELAPEMAAKLHIMPESVMERRVQAREFSTVETCYEDLVDDLKLPSLYSQHYEHATCYVYWGLKPKPASLR